jgi:hypothetical protein
MSNSATQNPANKVGRNSGGGPAGVSEAVPTAAEAARGVQAIGGTPPGGRKGAAGAGAVALLGTGLAVWLARRARRPRGRIERLRAWAGL